MNITQQTINVPFTCASTLTTKSKALCDYIIENKDKLNYGFTMLAFKNAEVAVLLHNHVTLGLEKKPSHYKALYEAFFPSTDEKVNTDVCKPKAAQQSKMIELTIIDNTPPATAPKRGRPAKTAIATSVATAPVVAKRGRPAKTAVATTGIVATTDVATTPKRGRPSKAPVAPIVQPDFDDEFDYIV